MSIHLLAKTDSSAEAYVKFHNPTWGDIPPFDPHFLLMCPVRGLLDFENDKYLISLSLSQQHSAPPCSIIIFVLEYLSIRRQIQLLSPSIYCLMRRSNNTLVAKSTCSIQILFSNIILQWGNQDPLKTELHGDSGPRNVQDQTESSYTDMKKGKVKSTKKRKN